MSRAIAVALLAVLACDGVSFGLFANGASTLPACCRRDGKHHCIMRIADPDSGAAWTSTARPCSQFPAGITAVHRQDCTPAPAPRLVAAPVTMRAAACPQPSTLYRVPLICGWQKRGPPSLA